MIDGHPYLHYDEVEGNYMLKNAILVEKPITKHQKEVQPDYFILELRYDKTSDEFVVDWFGTEAKGSYAWHINYTSAKKHFDNVIKMIKGNWDIVDVRYDVEYEEYNDADFGKGYSAPEVKAERGMAINENAEMILNNNKQIAHHTKELAEVVNKDTHVPAWVVAKTFRSATDLSDVTHYLEGNSNKFAKGGWTEYLDKAKNYGKRAYQVAKENYGKAKAYTQQKIRDKQKQIALDVLYETRENLATGRDEHIAMEKAFHIVDEKFAGGGSTKPEKIKVAFYKWGEYQGDEEIDLIDLPERELTSDELMGFDIREEDENKHFYASELDIDDTNVEEEGYGVKRAYATDKQYN